MTRCRAFVLALFGLSVLCLHLQHSTAVSANKNKSGAQATADSQSNGQPAKGKSKSKKGRSNKARTNRNAGDAQGAAGGSSSAGSGNAAGGIVSGSGSSSGTSANANSSSSGSGKTSGGAAPSQPVSNPTQTKPGGGAPAGDGGAKPAPQQGPNAELVKKVIDIQNRHHKELVAQEGVAGTVTGLDDDGNVIIKVYTTGAGNPKIPKQIENVAVQEVLTGPWRALYQGAAFDPKLRQSRPVPTGVSIISENGACGNVIAAGTLGCRLRPRDGSAGVYILSNNHVLAAENMGIIGDKIVQPGSLDAFNDGLPICAPSDVIGTLFKFKPIDFSGTNLIDAAIAKTDVTNVSNATATPPAYGQPRTTTYKSFLLGIGVQKLGRTTGYTQGNITGINQMISVGYTAGVATFIDQLEITGNGFSPQFANPGDSGSLIVDMDRFPVGLLFAGAGPLVNANHIQNVLDEFDMVIDGDDSPFPPKGKEGRSDPNSP